MISGKRFSSLFLVVIMLDYLLEDLVSKIVSLKTTNHVSGRKSKLKYLDQTITKDFIYSEYPETSALLHFLMQLNILHKPTEKKSGKVGPKNEKFILF